MTRISLFLLLASVLVGEPASAQAYYSDQGTALFRSSVPLHSFEGTSDRLVGRISLADSTVDFYLDLATLRTGIGKRDKDMRKTLEVDEYPFAEFFGRLQGVWNPALLEPQPVEVEGTFKIHGIARELTVLGRLSPVDLGVRLVAEWSLNLEDYDIEPPKLLIMKVDPVQRLSIDITLKLEETP